MRVITWNVARRSSRLAEQAAALAAREPDVVALQEVTDTTLPLWRVVLERIGLPHVRASLDHAERSRTPAQRRRTGVLLGSRTAPGDPSATLPVPWSETAVAAVAATAIADRDPLPACSKRRQRLGKSAHASGHARGASRRAAGAGRGVRRSRHRRRELESGEVLSFARDSRGRLRPERGPEWDEAELGVVPGLRDLGTATPIARSTAADPAGRAGPGSVRSWRRLAPRPPIHLGRVGASDLSLPPLVARRGPKRPLRARG